MSQESVEGEGRDIDSTYSHSSTKKRVQGLPTLNSQEVSLRGDLQGNSTPKTLDESSINRHEQSRIRGKRSGVRQEYCAQETDKDTVMHQETGNPLQMALKDSLQINSKNKSEENTLEEDDKDLQEALKRSLEDRSTVYWEPIDVSHKFDPEEEKKQIKEFENYLKNVNLSDPSSDQHIYDRFIRRSTNEGDQSEKMASVYGLKHTLKNLQKEVMERDSNEVEMDNQELSYLESEASRFMRSAGSEEPTFEEISDDDDEPVANTNCQKRPINTSALTDVKYIFVKGNKEVSDGLVSLLQAMGAEEAKDEGLATHIIHLDISDELSDRCMLIYEDYEDLCVPNNECADKGDFDRQSSVSRLTIDSHSNEREAYQVNYQWVFNCKDARKRLDEALFPIS